MKVAICATSFHYISGVTIATEALANWLSGMGHEPVVYSLRSDRSKPFPVLSPFGGLDGKPDVIQCNGVYPVEWLSMMLGKIRKIPVIWYCHTDVVMTYGMLFGPFGGIAQKIARAMFHFADSHSSAIVAPSEYTRACLAKYGFSGDKVTVLPTPVPCQVSYGPDRTRKLLNVPAEAKVVLSVGRLWREKNVGLLIEAFQLVSREIPSVYLVVVGDGYLRRRLEKMCYRLGISDRVYFIGFLPHEIVKVVYHECDLVVQACGIESQCLVVSEAGACGKPAVVVNGGGVIEFIEHEHSGLVVEPNKEALAYGMIQLLRDTELARQLGKNNREFVRQNLDPDVIFPQLYGIYKEVIERRRGVVL